MKRVVMMIALAALPGCGLLFSADDHVGGGEIDGGPRDAAIDAADEPPTDAGEADAGSDAGPPPPPECTTSAECGAPGLVQCVSQRCQFCATPDAAARTLRDDAALRPQVALAFGTRDTGPPYVHVAAFQGAAGATSSWHRFELGSPTVETHTIAAAGGQLCGGTEPYDRVLGGAFADGGAGTMTLSYLGPRADRTYWQFLRWYDGGEPDVSVYDCRPTMATTMLGPIVPITSTGTFGGIFVTRWISDTTAGLISVESGYGNEQERQTIEQVTREDVTHVAHANALVSLSSADRARQIFWIHDMTWPSFIDTPGRTTDADFAAVDADDYLMAYGVGALIRVVPVHCEGYDCMPMGDSADVRTDAESVDVVRVALSSGSMPLLLSVEERAGGDQLVMRALRPSRAPWDAPGGGRALVVESAPEGEDILDAQLVTAGTGATVRHAVAWLRAGEPGAASVLAQGYAGACEP
ncbi:hypothetical protein [Sandaracinus amylolyticus]|uniref:hypothetical protein n=1 Tax=Sandaracinus amylolyticus TaxID=927083 RepID=UPI001F275806|nr:hypothetical protein [Sandaracinus amylolyticus]UJR83950.1 Hypothetical protein I5071_60210 [Sandaracinus amylolyticus]